jgi:transposase
MFHLNPNLAVYLHREPIDFRKNINGLAALVEHELKLDPFAQAAYVFANRARDRIKILSWSRNGFWLLQKRLENERFVWPHQNQPVIELTVQQLHWLLEGIDLVQVRAHAAVHYQRAS